MAPYSLICVAILVHAGVLDSIYSFLGFQANWLLQDLSSQVQRSYSFVVYPVFSCFQCGSIVLPNFPHHRHK